MRDISAHRTAQFKFKADSSLYDSSSDTKSKTALKPASGIKIARNYAQAFCTFASSKLAIPYLKNIIEQHYQGKVEVHFFQRFIKSKKRNTQNIVSLRDLLLIRPENTEKEVIYKKLFAQMCEIFIKYFSVNWIFSGKMKLREEHLRFRYKMLRRIRDPEHFTYLTSQVNLDQNM